MKCALDLQITAQVRAKEIAVQEKLALREQTAKFCERLGKTLEAQANQGMTPTVSFYFAACGGVLEETWKDYADCRMSYRSTGVNLDLQYLAEWFHQYCFKVSATKCTGWRYNWGETQFQCITIKPDPQCLS